MQVIFIARVSQVMISIRVIDSAGLIEGFSAHSNVEVLTWNFVTQ